MPAVVRAGGPVGTRACQDQSCGRRNRRCGAAADPCGEIAAERTSVGHQGQGQARGLNTATLGLLEAVPVMTTTAAPRPTRVWRAGV